MTSRIVFLTLGLMTLANAPAPAQFRPGDPAAQTGWLFSLEEGKSRARASGKPLMVVIRCVP
jgi:hypothetical protein